MDSPLLGSDIMLCTVSMVRCPILNKLMFEWRLVSDSRIRGTGCSNSVRGCLTSFFASTLYIKQYELLVCTPACFDSKNRPHSRLKFLQYTMLLLDKHGSSQWRVHPPAVPIYSSGLFWLQARREVCEDVAVASPCCISTKTERTNVIGRSDPAN